MKRRNFLKALLAAPLAALVSKVSAGEHRLLPPATHDEFTGEAWVRREDAGSPYDDFTLVEHKVGATDWRIMISSEGILTYRNGEQVALMPWSNFELGKYTHFAVTQDRQGKITQYINGVVLPYELWSAPAGTTRGKLKQLDEIRLSSIVRSVETFLK